MVPDNKSECFPLFLAEATILGIDVNDYEDYVLGHISPAIILRQTLFPYLDPNAKVLEIGPGTGRVARHILKYLSNDGRLYLCDHSPWIMNFLQGYFADQTKVVCCPVSTGSNLTVPDQSINAIYAHAVFVELSSLQIFDLLTQSYVKLLLGGYAIFSFNSISTEYGQKTFREVASGTGRYHHFYTDELIKFIVIEAGFSEVDFYVSPKCPAVKFAICRK